MDAIKVKDLVKRYGDLVAVDHLSFTVKKGSLFAFLGENGAGKSTTISILCGILEKDEGEVQIEDVDVNVAKGRLGVVFQHSVLDAPLTVEENLYSRGVLYGFVGKEAEERVRRVTELFQLGEILNRPVGKLSGGQRRRVDLARALLHGPEILILDEPTTGLDPQTRAHLWQVLEMLREKEGLTVFLTTHYMEEASSADQVVILEKGRIAAQGSPLELKNRYTGDFITLYHTKKEDVAFLGLPVQELGDGVRLNVKDTAAATDLILSHPRLFRDYEITKGKMDDVFLTVTGKSLKEEGES